MKAFGGALLWLVSRPIKRAWARRAYKREVLGKNLRGTGSRPVSFSDWYETRQRQRRVLI